jgi:hypothetical protein
MRFSFHFRVFILEPKAVFLSRGSQVASLSLRVANAMIFSWVLRLLFFILCAVVVHVRSLCGGWREGAENLRQTRTSLDPREENSLLKSIRSNIGLHQQTRQMCRDGGFQACVTVKIGVETARRERDEFFCIFSRR